MSAEPYYDGDRHQVYLGECIETVQSFDDDSVHSIVTDPPYGLKFMGKEWDHGVPGVPFWEAFLRVAKPGAHLLAFGGTKTFHRLACSIEDAGWELRDCMMWVYGSGFPKSMDVSKAIDKAAGAEREVVGSVKKLQSYGHEGNNCFGGDVDRGGVMQITAPATDDAKKWNGWGTALKPAWEPIIMGRKPFKGTVADNVLTHGTGALNIDGCRVESPDTAGKVYTRGGNQQGSSLKTNTTGVPQYIEANSLGRWPANLIHDGSDEVVGLFPDSGGSKPGSFQREMISRGYKGGGLGQRRADDHAEVGIEKPGYDDSGSAARFFYCAKAPKKERRGSKHPTVKPLDLMRYLVRMVTPPDGIVMDPFCGSGSTLEAAQLEGFGSIGVDQEFDFVEDSIARLIHKEAC